MQVYIYANIYLSIYLSIRLSNEKTVSIGSITLVQLVLIWFGLVLWHIDHGCLFHSKSCFCMYINYIKFVNTFYKYILKRALDPFIQFNGFKYFYRT